MNVGVVPYLEAWELQRSLAGAVSQGAIPDTIILLEHPSVVTLGRRADDSELHVPADAEVEVVEIDRGGKSTYHAPGQLVCYPILDLTRHGTDVKRYCRDLEEALISTLKSCGLQGKRIEGLTGIWLQKPTRKIALIGNATRYRDWRWLLARTQCSCSWRSRSFSSRCGVARRAPRRSLRSARAGRSRPASSTPTSRRRRSSRRSAGTAGRGRFGHPW